VEWGGIITTLGGLVIGGISAAFVYLYKSLEAAKDKAIAKAEADAVKAETEAKESIAKAEARADKIEKERDTFRDLLRDAVATLPAAVNNALERQGKQPMPDMAAVVPISHSPVTPEDEREAEIYTALAVTAASKLVLGIAPRVAEPRAGAVTIETTVKEVAVGEPKVGDKAGGEGQAR
jgi:hypothetical protein